MKYPHHAHFAIADAYLAIDNLGEARSLIHDSRVRILDTAWVTECVIRLESLPPDNFFLVNPYTDQPLNAISPPQFDTSQRDVSESDFLERGVSYSDSESDSESMSPDVLLLSSSPFQPSSPHLSTWDLDDIPSPQSDTSERDSYSPSRSCSRSRSEPIFEPVSPSAAPASSSPFQSPSPFLSSISYRHKRKLDDISPPVSPLTAHVRQKCYHSEDIGPSDQELHASRPLLTRMPTSDEALILDYLSDSPPENFWECWSIFTEQVRVLPSDPPQILTHISLASFSLT